MEPINNQLKSLLYLVDNFGFIRSANSEIGDEISFHCFIGDCKFKTKNLGYMIDHAGDHNEKWSGFCYACNSKIFDEKMFLLKELSHMDGHKFLEDGISIDVSDITLQAAVINAKARRLCSDDCCDENFEILLKPWIKPTMKTPNNCRKMLSKICLYALYKCMEVNCAFFTSCANNMCAHLQHHANCSGLSGWLECAYCDLISDSCPSLVQHIWKEHGSSLYQCPYCFYRSYTAHNVVFHLTQFHDTREKSVLVCNGKKMLFTAKKAKAVIQRLRSENVRPLRCSEVCCNRITYLMDDFIVHLKNSNELDENFNCQRCGSSISISEATEHLLSHNFGVYQCIYCIHGQNDIKSIQHHMVHTHPTEVPFICVRLTRKNQNLRNEEQATVESTMIAELVPTVDSSLLKRCPFTDEQLSNNLLVAVTTSNSRSRAFAPSEISRVGEHPNNPASHRQFASQDILSYNELRDDYTSDDWNQYFATHLSSSLVDVSQNSVDSGIGPHLSVSDGETNDPNSVQATGLRKRLNDQQREIDEAAYDLVRHTGLEGPDLYRCYFPTCNEKFDDFDGFGYHCSGTETPFVAQNVVALRQHIQSHGIHRFFCYICDFTCSIEDKDHIQQAHNNQPHSSTLPLNPMKIDSNKDMFVMCPSGVAENDLIQFGRYLIKRRKELCASSSNSNDHNSLVKQIQAPVLQTNSESIRSDDGTCNDATPIQIIECGQPIVAINEDTDNVNVIRRSEPLPVIPIVNTNSILNTPDDEEDPKPSKSKPQPKPRARPQPKSTAVPQPKAKAVPQPKPGTRTQTKLKETTEKVINATDVVQNHTTTTTKKISEPKWYESVKYICAHCPNSHMNLGDVYEHWKSNHEKAAVPSPFRFRIVKAFKCYHCRQCNTYAVSKQHCQQIHPGKGFAMVDIANTSKCGLCDSVGTDIIGHFKGHHNSNAGINYTIGLEDYLTDELLNKFKSLSVIEDQTTDDQIMYRCSKCKAENSNQMDTVVHMRQHLIQFQCKFESCNGIFESLSLIKTHHKIVHGDDETYRNVDINENLDKYLNMKIIFPNGLLLTKRECQHTDHGAMDEVKEMIEQIHDRHLRELRKRPAEKRKNERSSPKHQKKKKKRTN